MKECWINFYYYAQDDYTFMGKDKFKSLDAAVCYIPSVGLRIAYRVHVRMK